VCSAAAAVPVVPATKLDNCNSTPEIKNNPEKISCFSARLNQNFLLRSSDVSGFVVVGGIATTDSPNMMISAKEPANFTSNSQFQASPGGKLLSINADASGGPTPR
jgi:hypothetical protein